MSDSADGTWSRRRFLTGAGAAGALALAGCTEGGSGTPTDGGGGGGGGGGGDNDGGGGSGSGSGGSGSISGEISITGSSTVFPLATAVAEQFEEQYSGVSTNIQSTGSGGGFANFFCPGDSDINNASRSITEDERQSCMSNDVVPHEIKVATDALTVVVNNDNDWATQLTFDELTQIFGPEAQQGDNWSDINGDWPDEEIERYGAATTSGTFDYFTETVIGESGAHTQAYSPTENDRSIVQGVTGSQYAIGYFGFSYYYNNPDQVTAVELSESGDSYVAPSLDTARSGDYPLARPLFTYPNENRLDNDAIAEFCRYFIEQSTNQDLVAGEVGYVPNQESRAQQELEDLNAAIEEANA
jgi:phosphate transport system substrate-binding protein